jgi:hypothetical protein
MLGFFVFAGSLIITNHAGDLRAFMLVIGQAVGFLLNFWLIHRNSIAQRQDTSEVQRTAKQVQKTLEDVKNTVDGANGNTPPPPFPTLEPS